MVVLGGVNLVAGVVSQGMCLPLAGLPGYRDKRRGEAEELPLDLEPMTDSSTASTTASTHSRSTTLTAQSAQENQPWIDSYCSAGAGTEGRERQQHTAAAADSNAPVGLIKSGQRGERCGDTDATKGGLRLLLPIFGAPATTTVACSAGSGGLGGAAVQSESMAGGEHGEELEAVFERGLAGAVVVVGTDGGTLKKPAWAARVEGKLEAPPGMAERGSLTRGPGGGATGETRGSRRGSVPAGKSLNRFKSFTAGQAAVGIARRGAEQEASGGSTGEGPQHRASTPLTPALGPRNGMVHKGLDEVPHPVPGLKKTLRVSKSKLTAVLEELATLKVKNSRSLKEVKDVLTRNGTDHAEALEALELRHDEERQEWQQKHTALRNKLCAQLLTQQSALLHACVPWSDPREMTGAAEDQSGGSGSERSERSERSEDKSRKRKKKKKEKKVDERLLAASRRRRRPSGAEGSDGPRPGEVADLLSLADLASLVHGLGDLSVLREESSGLPELVAERHAEAIRLEGEFKAVQKETAVLSTRYDGLCGRGLEDATESDIAALEGLHARGMEQLTVARAGVQSREVERLQAETESIQDRAKCCVCLTNPIETLIQPCSHFCVCGECAATLESCPICRGAIKNRLAIDIQRQAAVPEAVPEAAFSSLDIR